MELFIAFAYIVSASLFIFGLKLLGHPASARKGNLLSAVGMLTAVIATLLMQEIIDYTWIVAGILLGSLIGVWTSRKVAMTSMPEMVALLNGLGGLSSLLVAVAVYMQEAAISQFTAATLAISVAIGGITFTGSMVAWGKLSGFLGGKPFLFTGQKVVNLFLYLFLCALCFSFSQQTPTLSLLLTLSALSLLLGVFSVIPIGGADMPVVISLLNSYSGIAASAAGFVIQNNLLIVAGALVGASGIILTSIMCKAMNRSLRNVLFSGFGQKSSTTIGEKKEAKSLTPSDAYYVLEAAKSILIVPGYGLAVAQAQHTLKELSALFEKNGAEVKYAIHPVAGRMPGHMNVLLAEAGISYEQLVEMDDINPQMEMIDVCLVIGANDVVNPAAIEDSSSAIYGMPVIETHRARNVFVLKRSMGSGFAGIENPLFFKDNTSMIFGDAKKTLQALVQELKTLS